MVNKSFAVFGLGRFGFALAKALVERKGEITVFDKNEKKINNFQALYPSVNAVITDVTNPNFIEEQGLENFDAVILALSSDLETNLLAAVMLKNAEVNNLVVRAKDDLHKKILKTIGIENIIVLEEQVARITASQVLFGIDSSIQLINDDYVILDIELKNPEKAGKSLEELNLLNKKDYNIVAY